TVGATLGGRRCFVALSYAAASRMSVASLQARPKNEIPTGNPRTYPAGTVMCGYPATAATVDGLDTSPPKLSPLTRSVSDAGPDVGATSASSVCCAITASMPCVRDSRRSLASAARYFGSVSGPFFCAITMISCPKKGSSSIFVRVVERDDLIQGMDRRRRTERRQILVQIGLELVEQHVEFAVAECAERRNV